MHSFGKVTIAVLALGFIFCLVLLFNAFVIRAAARSAVEAVRELSVSPDPKTTLTEFEKRFGSRLRQASFCSPSDCVYEMAVSNSWLSALRIVPYTELVVRLNIARGYYGSNIDYQVIPHGAEGPVVHVQWDDCPNCNGLFAINPHGRNSSNRLNGVVEINRGATAEQRNAAFAINVDCLTRLSGCRDIAQMLPTIWKMNSDGNIASRMHSISDASDDWPR